MNRQVNNMQFSEFVTNVQGWQRDRGIYDHSTPLAQALKAVSEVGELADAVIKGDSAGIKDGIGDVMVCLVGVATMRSQSVGVDFVASANPATGDERYHARMGTYKTVQEAVAVTAAMVSGVAALNTWDHPPEDLIQALQLSAAASAQAATLAGVDFGECCEAAWLEIKDRKGRMVPGGAFVKE